MRIHDTYCTLGKDPEYVIAKNGMPMVKFTVAVSNDYKDKETNEWIKRDPFWYNCVIFGELADDASVELTKGTRIKILSGKYERRRYQDKEGKWVESNTVIIYEYELLSSK